MKKIRILVIEDNRVLRDGITTMLNEQADMHVAAIIGSGNNVLLKASQAKPHVILMDVGMKNFNESSVIESVRKNMPEAKVIGTGFIPSQSDIVEFVEAGGIRFHSERCDSEGISPNDTLGGTRSESSSSRTDEFPLFLRY